MGEILLPKTNQCKNDLDKGCENSNIEDGSCKGGSKTYLCSQCDKAFRSKDTLLRHKISHSGAKPFSCDICKKGLSSAVSLKEHKAKHSEQKLYECSICRRSFRQNSSYRRHLTTHSKASPHECGLCKRRFAQRAYLRSHMKMHTGEKPYLCDPPCNKSFAHLSDLKRHRVLHTGKRPYKCGICGSSFADRSSRRRHQKDHENKPWNHVCEVCKSAFKKATQLEKHMSKAHGVASLLCLRDVENIRNSVNGSSVPVQVCENNFNVSAVQIFSNRNDVSLMELPESDVEKSHETVPLEVPVGDLSTQGNHPHFKGSSDVSSLQVVDSSDQNRIRNSCSLSEIQSRDMTESLKRAKQDDETSAMLPASCQNNLLPSFDYVLCPDFSSQEYYEWLTDFVSLCKLLPCPVETEVFGKINQVHKSIVDCLSSPTELVCNKTNFKSLLDLSQDLFRIINRQLNFILSQLPD